jgi:hypothetical protein
MRWGGLALTLVVLASWWLRLPRGPNADALDLDVNLYFYPLYEATAARLATGVLPTWNPYQLCGIPWLATLQAGVFYPVHALYLGLPLHVGLAVSTAFHLTLATLATAAFARRAGLSITAALMAGGLYGLRGMFAGSPAAPAYMEAAAWMPLGAVAVLDLGTPRIRRGAALLAIATAMSLLAGYPQPTTYMLGVWASLLVVARPSPTGVAAFAGALALGALAAGVQLAPAIELLHDGAHRALTPEAMAPFGISPAEILLATQSLAGGVFAWGAAALALGVAATAARPRRLAWWALAVALGSALLAMGDRTPLFALYRAVPLLGSFRFPDRLLGVTDFAFAVAAAAGLDAIVRAPARRPAAGLAIAATLAVVGLAFAGAAPVEQRWRVLLAAGTVTGILIARLVGGGRGALALVVVVAAEILSSPWRYLVTYTPRTVERYGVHAAAYRALAARAGADRVWFWSGIATLQPEHALKLATRYGVHAIDDYEPLAPRRQRDYFTYFSEGDLEYRRPPWLFAGDLGTLGVTAPATRRRLLDAAALRFMVVPTAQRTQPDLLTFVRDAGLEERDSPDPALVVFENPHTLPRAFVVHRTRPAPEPDVLLPTLAAPTFDPLAESWIEGATAATDGPRGAPARITLDQEREVEVEATLPEPGVVVLADAYYPGWRATVDGATATIEPVNLLFRGVRTTAGTHRVRFEYRPASVTAGAVASIVGWLGIAAAWLAARRRYAV